MDVDGGRGSLKLMIMTSTCVDQSEREREKKKVISIRFVRNVNKCMDKVVPTDQTIHNIAHTALYCFTTNNGPVK